MCQPLFNTQTKLKFKKGNTVERNHIKMNDDNDDDDNDDNNDDEEAILVFRRKHDKMKK